MKAGNSKEAISYVHLVGFARYLNLIKVINLKGYLNVVNTYWEVLGRPTVYD